MRWVAIALVASSALLVMSVVGLIGQALGGDYGDMIHALGSWGARHGW